MDITQEISDTPDAKKAFSALRQETLVVTAVLAILTVALGLRLFGLNSQQNSEKTKITLA